MSRKRLKDNHPLVKKLDEVFDLMSKLDISIFIGRYGGLSITHNGEMYDLNDLEDNNSDCNQTVEGIPPSCEWKLNIRDDE